jgi:hypothetical protein
MPTKQALFALPKRGSKHALRARDTRKRVKAFRKTATLRRLSRGKFFFTGDRPKRVSSG